MVCVNVLIWGYHLLFLEICLLYKSSRVYLNFSFCECQTITEEIIACPFYFYIRLAKDLYFLQNAEGSGLAPFDCWICLRGIKTMALRVEKQQVLCFKPVLENHINETLFLH